MTAWFDQRRMVVLQCTVVLAAAALYAMLAPGNAGSLALLTVFVAATCAAVAGFAFSPICGALLFHLWDAPVDVVRILMLCSIANQIMTVCMMWHDIRWRRLAPFLLFGSAGVPLGVMFLVCTDTGPYIVGFGILLIGYSTIVLLRPPSRNPFSCQCAIARWGDRIIGLLGGVMGGLAATPGMPLVMWLAHRGGTKIEQRALFQPFILAMQCEAIATLALMTLVEPGSAPWNPGMLAFVPLSLLGTWCGVTLFRQLSDRQFGSITHIMLIVSGVALVL